MTKIHLEKAIKNSVNILSEICPHSTYGGGNVVCYCVEISSHIENRTCIKALSSKIVSLGRVYAASENYFPISMYCYCSTVVSSCSLVSICYFTLRMGAKHCDEYVCLSVCLSVCLLT